MPESGVTAPATAPGLSADEIAFMNSTRGELATLLHITLVEASPERLVATMPVEGNRQPYGLLHGGATAALAETLGSYGAALAAGPGRAAVGIDLNITHHRAATTGTVTGVATKLYSGRSLATFEIAVTDAGGKRVATGRLTCLIRDVPPAGGRVARPGGAPESATTGQENGMASERK